ncbi:MAG: phospholipid carrier-dependent glycosyltransferase [Clostridiaceae bacterium]|nr:phospholipid carrier-dependent glycosyltransferase [Clostridiaceae bacterium]
MTGKINKKDIKIMAVMTVIYLIIALIYLGSFKAPKTGWEPDNLNESFIVDFGREVTIDKIMLFGGIGHSWGCFGTLEIEAYRDGEFEPYTFIDMKSVYKWHYTTASVTTEKLRFTATYLRTDNENDKNKFYKAEYKEMGFFSGNDLISGFTVTEKPQTEGIEKLFDEQDLVPDRPSVLNSTYFDEIYFPRTALEQLEKRDILYENTHPPLGKTIIAFGISIFGMTPFGWRIMGTLFGAAMIPLMYIIAKRFFKDTFWAFFCAWLMMFDFMHFTQTRLATIDSYTVFFVMLMFYSMLDYYDSKSYERGFFKSHIPLLLCGISLGLGGATKWIALYGAFGLAILFFLSRGYEYNDFNNQLNIKINNSGASVKLKEKELGKWLGKYFYLTCLFCVLFFIVIPAAIYVLSFIPIHYNDKNTGLIESVIESVKSMYNYHKGVSESHPFESPWYEWPLDIRPIFYYQGELLPDNWGASIACFGHPLLFWIGLVSFFIILWSLISSIFKKENFLGENKLVLFPVIGYLSQYLPWVVAPRKVTFIYHYFSCTPFLILMVGIIFRYLEEKNIIGRFTKVFLIVYLTFFILYYPLLSGLEVPRIYLEILRILPRWDW